MVIIDKDIVRETDVYDAYASVLISDKVQWLVREIHATIAQKKNDLMKIMPGAVFCGDPKVIFVRMLRRYINYTPGSKLDLLFGLHPKFNDCLNNTVAEIEQKMLTVTACNSRDHFDFHGNLTIKGKYDYWREIDDLLERFDKREIKLLPTPLNLNREYRDSSKSSDYNDNRRKRSSHEQDRTTSHHRT